MAEECKNNCNPHEYSLTGPQVEPAAGYWMFCPKLRIVDIDELRALTDDKSDAHYFPPYPTDPGTLSREIDELIELAEHRDDPCYLVNARPCPKEPDVCKFEKRSKEHFGCRRPISRLWNLCPYPLGGVLVNRPPGDQIIRTGRGLARAVESETPGLYHRHIADFLMKTRNWSPPRQALVWAALDIAIASALQAAWYYKWLAVGREKPDCTAFRERPIEYTLRNKLPLTVLFDKPDELNPAYNPCPDGRDPNVVSSGTPRHPAYPSGHSTYSAAASEILSFFFGEEETPPFLGAPKNATLKEEFDNLADNIGLGRMWAGVHWRSDHEAGQKLGRTVACLVLRQLANMPEFKLCPDERAYPCNQCDFDVKVKPCNEKEKPPHRSDLCKTAKKVRHDCPKDDHKEPDGPCKKSPGCIGDKDHDHWKARIDGNRGTQQGGGT